MDGSSRKDRLEGKKPQRGISECEGLKRPRSRNPRVYAGLAGQSRLASKLLYRGTYTISHDDWLRESEAAMYTYDTYSFPTVRKDLTLRLQFRFFNMNHRKPALIQWKVATRCVVDRQQRMRLLAFLLPREGRRGSLTADCTFAASLTQLTRQIAALSRKSERVYVCERANERVRGCSNSDREWSRWESKSSRVESSRSFRIKSSAETTLSHYHVNSPGVHV